MINSQNSLLAFIQEAFEGFRVAPHHKVICEALERGECKRLMVLMPPRHSKTELLKRFFLWYLGRNPQEKISLSAKNS